MTTAKSITHAQIRTLRVEAIEAGDSMQVAICDLAIDGTIDADDYTTLDHAEDQRIRAMSAAEAIAECVEVITEAAAQS